MLFNNISITFNLNIKNIFNFDHKISIKDEQIKTLINFLTNIAVFENKVKQLNELRDKNKFNDNSI